MQRKTCGGAWELEGRARGGRTGRGRCVASPIVGAMQVAEEWCGARGDEAGEGLACCCRERGHRCTEDLGTPRSN